MVKTIYLSLSKRMGVAKVVKKILTWGGLAFLLFFIAFRPNEAAEVFKSLGSGIMDIAEGLGDFFSALVR